MLAFCAGIAVFICKQLTGKCPRGLRRYVHIFIYIQYDYDYEYDYDSLLLLNSCMYVCVTVGLLMVFALPVISFTVCL